MGQEAASLGASVAATEARLFVGRVPELDALVTATNAASEAPVVVYVHGPPGVGKSTLLRAYGRWCAAAGRTLVTLDGRAGGDSQTDLLATIARQLAVRRPAGAPSLATVTRACRRTALRGGLSLVLDTYEALSHADRWLRTNLLYALGPDTCIVLGGRPDPDALWPDDPPFALLVRRLQLADLDERASLDYARAAGVSNPDLAREAYRVSGGRPLLLTLATGLARAGQEPSAAAPWGALQAGQGRERLAVRLLGHVVAAASLPALETAVRAACLVRTFDRELLAAMVGDEVAAAAWPTLVALPVVRPVAGRYTVHEAVRGPVGEEVRRTAPWLDHRWRRRAIAHHVARVRREPPGAAGSLAWRETCHLAATAPWRSWLEPWPPERDVWRLRRGARASDLADLVVCREATLAGTFGVDAEGLALARASLERLLAACADHFVIAHDPAGRLVAYCVPVPVTPATTPVLAADPAAGALVSWLDGSRLATWQDRTLMLFDFGLHEPSSEGYFVLFREACDELAWYDRLVVVTALEAAASLAPLLGGVMVDGFSAMLPGRTLPNRAFLLELGGGGYATWLERIAAPVAAASMAPTARSGATQDLLLAIGRGADDGELRRSAAAQYYAKTLGEPAKGTLVAWLTDALEAATFPSGHGIERTILARYYLDRAGPHERLAEELGLSRRHYFRYHRQALSALGDQLFG